MLSARHRVVSIDLADPRAGALELEHLEQQVRGVLDSLDLHGITLVGYSLGAVVAAALAGHHPRLVDTLILIAGWMRTDAQQLLRNDIWGRLRGTDPLAAQQFSTYAAFSPGFLKLLSEPQRDQMIAAVQFDSFKDSQMELNRRVDITDALRTVDAETLIIGCRDDMMVPTHHSKQLFGAIESARYVEIISGHAVVAERPAELVHWIDSFTNAPARFPVGAVLDTPRP